MTEKFIKHNRNYHNQRICINLIGSTNIKTLRIAGRELSLPQKKEKVHKI